VAWYIKCGELGIKYFFSLVLEDYFGDKEELMDMADIDEEELKNFFNT